MRSLGTFTFLAAVSIASAALAVDRMVEGFPDLPADARAVADSFTLALQMAAPFLVYGLVFTGAMGLLARLMPTLQVFFVAMPAQLLIGIGLLAVTLSSMMIWFLDTYERQIAPFLPQ